MVVAVFASLILPVINRVIITPPGAGIGSALKETGPPDPSGLLFAFQALLTPSDPPAA